MKAVIYHADATLAWGKKPPKDAYKNMTERFKAQCHSYGMQVVHLTCEGHPQWGDEGRSFPLEPANVVANREECFTSFLETAPDDWYWFTEPDCYIVHPIPPPEDCDLVMLFRQGDDVPMCPAWRMATPKALPFFLKTREEMRAEKRKDWHGDSGAFTKVWNEMGKPGVGRTEYLGLKIEFRKYGDYIKPGKYTSNKLGPSKF